MIRGCVHFAITSVLIVCVCGCEPKELHREPANNSLKIVVYYSTADNKEGYSAAKKGADAAQKVETFQSTAKDYKLEIVTREDADNINDASTKAREDRTNPEILAVVGHSRSSTTLAALPFYAEAGIPVLMPSATSPYVPYRFKLNESWPDVDNSGKVSGAPRFPRVFRLPPKDVPDQVDAIKETTLKLLSKKPEGATKQVMLV